VLAQYANCEISSNSLPRTELRRLFPQGEFLQFDAAEVPATKHLDTSIEEDRANSEHDSDLTWIKHLLALAQSKSPQSGLAEFAIGTDTVPFSRRLAGFGVSLLSSTSSSGKRVKNRDLPTVLKVLAESLGPLIKDREISEFDTPTALKLYVQAIRAQPVRLRRNLIKWIREFDLYLRVRINNREPLPLSQLPWPPDYTSEVDTNLITHEEYATILRQVNCQWDPKASDQRKRLVRLIIILSFRCGLRRHEIQRLRISDALLRGSPELLIWPQRGNRLKTRNAKRRIPIVVLMSSEELLGLRAWYSERIEIDKAGPEDSLFALPQERLSQIPKSLFEQLNKFLRRFNASGGESATKEIHEHILRHAFGGWLLVSMLLSEMDRPPVIFPHLVETNAWLGRGKEIRKALFRHSNLTGKHTYMIASLAGHADFGTTTHSYIHLFPWLLAAFLDLSQVMLPEQNLINLASRLPNTTFRDWLSRGGIHHVPAMLLKGSPQIHIKSLAIQDRKPLNRPGLAFKKDTIWLDPSWLSLWNQCTNTATSDSTPTNILMFARAEYICNLVPRRENSDT
jgi:integrase